MAYVALLDASVLHPWVVCDVLLRLAERGLYRPAWSGQILDEVVDSLTERRPEHAERFRRRREQMEAPFAEAMTPRPERFASVVPDEVHGGDRHVVAAALAARADVIVTNNARHFAPDRLAESGLLVRRPMSSWSINGGWIRTASTRSLRRWPMPRVGHRSRSNRSSTRSRALRRSSSRSLGTRRHAARRQESYALRALWPPSPCSPGSRWLDLRTRSRRSIHAQRV